MTPSLINKPSTADILKAKGTGNSSVAPAIAQTPSAMAVSQQFYRHLAQPDALRPNYCAQKNTRTSKRSERSAAQNRKSP